MNQNEETNQGQNVESPLNEELAKDHADSFDYNKYQWETTFQGIKSILKILGENVDLLVYDPNNPDENDIVENTNKVAQQVINAMIENKVPDTDMQKIIDFMHQTIIGVFSVVRRQKSEFEKELLARTIQAKDPGTGKFSREYATLGDLFLALRAKQEEQGVEAYYNIVPEGDQELPTNIK